MKEFCTYFYTDPKSGEYVYVGKGDLGRPFDHFHNSSQSQLSRMLRKRRREGYDPQPLILKMPSDNASKALEIFWIAVFGRTNIGTGTLFNRTAGGDGTVHRINTPEQIQNLKVAQQARWQKPGSREAHSEGQKRRFASEEYRKKWSEARKGPNHSNFGKCWVNDGIKNQTIPKSELEAYLQRGYRRGMKGKGKQC